MIFGGECFGVRGGGELLGGSVRFCGSGFVGCEMVTALPGDEVRFSGLDDFRYLLSTSLWDSVWAGAPTILIANSSEKTGFAIASSSRLNPEPLIAQT